MSDEISEINAALAGTLIPGNHELLSVFGSDAQNVLNESSRNITNILIQGNSELENNISAVLKKIQNMQKIDVRKNQKLSKQCRSTLTYIEDMTVNLQIQQARILKDIALLDQMEIVVNECTKKLHNYIDYAESVLDNTETDDNIVQSQNLQDWVDHLKKRIEGLKMSYIISIQSKEQISILKQNDKMILEKADTLINDIVPLWKKQASFLANLETIDNNRIWRDATLSQAEENLYQSKEELGKLKRNAERSHPVDLNKIEVINEQLTDLLNILLLIEQQDDSIKDKMSGVLLATIE